MRVLELFSGTSSFSKVARKRGHQTFTVDIREDMKPDMVADILNLKKSDFPIEFQNPDIVWASPPCTCFSVASIGTHWTGGWRIYEPKTERAKESKELIKKTVSLIKELNPKYYFIENPRGVLRKLNLIDGIPKTVMYCQYGDERMKPTDIWTNLKQWNPKTCKNGNKDHAKAPRGSKTGTQGRKNATERGIVPRRLCDELLEYVELSDFGGF